jgi:hypothetical protein
MNFIYFRLINQTLIIIEDKKHPYKFCMNWIVVTYNYLIAYQTYTLRPCLVL